MYKVTMETYQTKPQTDRKIEIQIKERILNTPSHLLCMSVVVPLKKNLCINIISAVDGPNAKSSIKFYLNVESLTLYNVFCFSLQTKVITGDSYNYPVPYVRRILYSAPRRDTSRFKYFNLNMYLHKKITPN